MNREKVDVHITGVHVVPNNLDSVAVNVDDKIVRIPVSSEVKAYFNQQFVRSNPTSEQRKKYITIKNLIRAAYLKGVEDGENS